MYPFEPRRVASAIPTERVLRIAVWCAFLVIISFTSADPDLWGHVRFGMDILRNGTVHQVDTYSFASDRAWVNHEWGAEVLAGWAFIAAGNPGLVVLKLLIVGSVLLLLNTALRIQGVTSGFLRDVTAGVAIVITLSQAHHVRPQLFSLLLFAVLLSSLVAADGTMVAHAASSLRRLGESSWRLDRRRSRGRYLGCRLADEARTATRALVARDGHRVAAVHARHAVRIGAVALPVANRWSRSA
jgi:hypothetical protein